MWLLFLTLIPFRWSIIINHFRIVSFLVFGEYIFLIFSFFVPSFGSFHVAVAKTLGSNLVRDRCDSLPSRNRTTSDCSSHSNVQNQSMPPPRTIPLAITNRPHSMYTNSYRHSNSPPYISTNVNANQGGPLSPSAGCSESDGSSLSIDETDGCFSHSLTPDDINGFGMKFYRWVSHRFYCFCCYYPLLRPTWRRLTFLKLFFKKSRKSGPSIPEENVDDFWTSSEGSNPKEIPSYMNTTTPTTPTQNFGSVGSSGSLTLPIQQNQNAVGIGNTTVQSIRRSSPGPTVYSPCGSSPGGDQMGTNNGYMMMSPAIDFSRKYDLLFYCSVNFHL